MKHCEYGHPKPCGDKADYHILTEYYPQPMWACKKHIWLMAPTPKCTVLKNINDNETIRIAMNVRHVDAKKGRL